MSLESLPRPIYRADPDRVLRILAESQFQDPYLAFRELYANALDAVRGRAGALIEVRVSAERVVVEDDGPGLDEAGLLALTTLGASTRRGKGGIGRFGIGFASVFDPTLGVAKVRFQARRVGPSEAEGVLLEMVPDVGGGVGITTVPGPPPPRGGSRVEIYFDPERAHADRVTRVRDIFREHAAYSGTQTVLDGRPLGRELSDYVRDELRSGRVASAERKLTESSWVKSAVGVAAIDPVRPDARFRVYARGLFVTELVVARPEGQAWPRGVFGAANAEGLELVTSRNGFVEDEAYARLLEELRNLAFEAAYRVVQRFEASRDAYARLVLLDALRRGLRNAAPEVIVAETETLFTSALVRCPLFRAWGEKEGYSFETLVELSQRGELRHLPYRPSRTERDQGPVLEARDSLEREIFRKLAGAREMPAAARGEEVAAPGVWSRLMDRILSGPQAEYSLFRHELSDAEVGPEARRLLEALERLMHAPELRQAIARLVPGRLPDLGFGTSRNAFGPIAAYRLGEIRFNVRHRSFRRLAKDQDAERAARGMLPVLAHELAHMCHDLHDLDFYRTSRALLRALVSATVALDARRLADAPTPGFDLESEPRVS